MAFRPNYRLQRADRSRAAQARSEEKQRKKDEKAAQRRAERTATLELPPDDDKASGGEVRVTAAESKGLKEG
jgi:hypothetical protein